MIKRFFRWWKRNHHICKGTVQYEYTVSASSFAGDLGRGICSICTCDICGKSFATVETATKARNVSVKVAVAEALTNGMLSQRYKDLLNNLARCA
jgi:hypothetical protein